MSVSDSPAEIEQAHQIAEAVRSQRRAARRPYIYLHHRNGPADDAVAADALAAVKAWQKGTRGSTEALADRLTRDDIDVRVAVLGFLAMGPARGFRGRDIAPAVIDNLRHPDPAVSRAAAWLCEKRHVPGAPEAALERAASGLDPDPSVLIPVATAHRDKNEVVAVVARLMAQATDSNQRHRLQDVLRGIARATNPVAGAAAREALAAAGIRWSPLAPAMDSRAVQAAVRTGGPERSVDELVALAAEFFDSHSQVVGLGTLAKGTGNDGLVERIVEDYGWEHSSSVRTALLHIGGAAAERWLLSGLRELDPTGRTELMWALEGSTLDHVLRRCREAGLIAEVPDSLTVKRVRYEHWGGYDDNEFTLFDPLIDLLVQLGAAVSFNYDPSAEIRYDKLIRKFGSCMPWFRLEALSERVLRIEGERDEMGRVVQFVAGVRRYRLDMDNTIGRYVYARQIVAMLNRALEDAGREERFLTVRRDERQVFLFARPDVARELAFAIYLPLDDEPALMNDAVQRFLDARR